MINALLGCPGPVCGGLAGTPCANGQFCELPAGMCNVADQLGACEPLPGSCAEVFAPVLAATA